VAKRFFPDGFKQMNTPELRENCANQLQAAAARAGQLKAFVGLDGFVDEILHVVDKRESADKFTRLPTIAKLADRLAAAAGKSTNLELVSQINKLGGNGPIMANALASLGLQVSYLGNLGYPSLHPVFADFVKRAEVYSIAEPGYTDALEFEDGKIMLGKHQSLKQVNWENIKSRFGAEKFAAKFNGSDFIGFVNWTMLTAMNDIWSAILRELCPKLAGPRRTLFFDLADPEKRTHEDIVKALELISAFEKHFDVIFGLNEKESSEIGNNLGLDTRDHSPEGLANLGRQILERVPVNTLVIHPTSYALAISKSGAATVEGPFTLKPLITTGAGDHFNAGFCLGKLLGLDNAMSVMAGVTTSGFYVRTAKSPGIADLVGLLRNWPTA
jgi:sugar/nucleoside kinase (ribokinase family)